jgi:hypothetical protein
MRTARTAGVRAQKEDLVMRFSSFTVLLGVVLLSGCGDPVSFSAPVGINLKTKASDVKNGVVTQDKGITTESGNPYSAFINEARKELDGKDPGTIEIPSLTLLLGAQSTGVTALEQVFTGKVEVLFVMNDTDNTYPVGNIENPKGSGPVELDVTFDSDTITGEDRTKLLGGSFKTVIRGPAATSFAPPSTAEATLQLTFTFESFE